VKKNRRNLQNKPRSRKKKRHSPATQRKRVIRYTQLKAIASAEGEVLLRIVDGKFDSPQAVHGSHISYTAYERSSGKQKVVSQVPGSDIHKRNIILDKFDVIAAVDTNDYVLQDGRRISISSSYYSEENLKSHPDSLKCTLAPSFIIDSPRDGLNPEVVGWHLFFTHILPHCISSEQRLALVVDSELGKHVSINLREEPYYNENYLPNNVTLLYASSDTGSELLNKVIRHCDKASRNLYSQVLHGEVVLPEALGGSSEDFAGYVRVIYTSRNG